MISHNLISCKSCVGAMGELRTKTKETGFLREYFVTGEEMGKNPVSKDCVRATRNLVSPIVRQGLKPLSHSESPLKRTKEFLIFISDFQSVSTDFRY